MSLGAKGLTRSIALGRTGLGRSIERKENREGTRRGEVSRRAREEQPLMIGVLGIIAHNDDLLGAHYYRVLQTPKDAN